jgi:hypothetical protein
MSEVDVTEFARRTERLCDFLLVKMFDEEGRVGSTEQKILEDLKDDAVNLQMFGARMTVKSLDGLDEFMHGLPNASVETKES